MLETSPKTHRLYANVLAIAASTSLCSLALHTPAGVFHWHSTETNKHSEQLLPAVAQLLQQAGIKKPDLIAVDIGPGAFTSVRVACGVAQGLALGWGCMVLPVQSLTALAYQALKKNPQLENPQLKTVTCIIDARMTECYVANYEILDELGGIKIAQTSRPCLMAYEHIKHEQIKTLNAHCVIGNAGAVLPQWLGLAADVVDAAPSAQGVLDAALLAMRGDEKPVQPEFLQPLYVRNQVAFTAEQRLAGLHKTG